MYQITVGSKWITADGKEFTVANVQDGVVWYIGNDNCYACNIEAFVERFNYLEQ